MADFPAVPADWGMVRQVLSDHSDLMVVSFRFDLDAQGKLHYHPHVQSALVRTGRFRFSVAGQNTEVGPGDSFVIPTNAVHGCTCLEVGELSDCFTPRRDNFL